MPDPLRVAEPHAIYERAMDAAVLALEAAAALVILVAAAQALLAFARGLARKGHRTEPARRRFAARLLLALDFTIGADVLKIALRPSFDGVLVVGMIVLVRILLTLLLEYELRRSGDGGAERS